ncbi:MAG: helix-turn-helix domain-containing protein, partial [Methylococcus sp.]|nr:helix-turn-helix domain-containing protein [Methylococcus sp.]
MTLPLLLSLQDAAQQLGGVSARTVRRMIEAGELPAVRVRGRLTVPLASIQAWVAGQIQTPHNQPCAGHVLKENITCLTNEKIVPFGGRR